MFQTQIVSQRKINDCYSFATISQLIENEMATQRLKINTFFHSNPKEESVILNVQYTG